MMLLKFIMVIAANFFVLWLMVECVVRFMHRPKHSKPDYAKIARMEAECGINQPNYPSINMLDAQKHYSGFSEWRAPSPY